MVLKVSVTPMHTAGGRAHGVTDGKVLETGDWAWLLGMFIHHLASADQPSANARQWGDCSPPDETHWAARLGPAAHSPPTLTIQAGLLGMAPCSRGRMRELCKVTRDALAAFARGADTTPSCGLVCVPPQAAAAVAPARMVQCTWL